VWLWSGWFVSFGLGAYVALLVGSRLLEPAPPGRDSPRFEIGKSEVSARPVAPGRIAASSDRRISTMEVDWPDLEIANQMPIVNTVHTTNGNIEYLSGAAAQAGSDGQADDVVYGPGAVDATER
jgi:hypothetical protein